MALGLALLLLVVMHPALTLNLKLKHEVLLQNAVTLVAVIKALLSLLKPYHDLKLVPLNPKIRLLPPVNLNALIICSGKNVQMVADQ